MEVLLAGIYHVIHVKLYLALGPLHPRPGLPALHRTGGGGRPPGLCGHVDYTGDNQPGRVRLDWASQEPL